MKKSILVCVMLACVASAMAVTFYEVPSDGNPLSNWSGFNYNPSPDPTVLNDWLTNTYVAPYSSFVPTPYYEFDAAVPAGSVPANADLRQNMITARFNPASNITANSMTVADSYWPLNYGVFGTTYTNQDARQTAGTLTFNTFNIGRDQSEWTDAGIAAHGNWNVRGGVLNAGDITVRNTTKVVTSPYGICNYRISNESSSNGLMTVSIGDINLNDYYLMLHMNGGTWNITGDLGGVGEKNAVFMLFGTRNPGGAVATNGGNLNIKYSTLLDMIAAGQFYTKTGNYGSRFRPGAEFDITNPTAVADVHLVTLANMFDELDIESLGDGMVSVHLIPEPATMVLLGLGAFVLRRKR